MQRRSLRISSIAIAFAIVGASIAGRARSDDAIRIRVDYAAASGCPSRAELVDEIRARSPRVVEAPAGEEAIGVAVRVTKERRGFAGTVTLRFAGAAPSSRTLAGASCSEVVAGLALMAAVAVDPILASAPIDASPAVSASASSSPSSSASPPANDASSASPPIDAGAPDVVEAQDAATPAPSASPPPPANGWRWSVGAEASLVASPAPATLTTALLFVDVARTSRFSPSARLRLERSLHDNATPTTPGVTFAWTVASIDACPTSWSSASIRVEPCVRVHGGILEATGANVVPTRDSTRPWASVGPLARARWALAPPLALEIEGALVVPLVRDRFFSEPNVTVFQSAVLGWSAAAGASFTIF
jgi:hypothetical protein